MKPKPKPVARRQPVTVSDKKTATKQKPPACIRAILLGKPFSAKKKSS